MARYLINDHEKKDERARLTAEKIATLTSEMVVPKKQYIEYASLDTLKILAGTIITIGESIFILDRDKMLTTTDLDNGSNFQDGKDYYIYVCDRGGKLDEDYKISLNSTFPSGYTAKNSRKIGGFHYGICRKISDNLNPVGTDEIEWSTDWETNVYLDILKYSIWTTHHRPQSEPEGMVFIGNNLWIDIYQASGNIKKFSSKKGIEPLTGTEGFDWYLFNEALSRANKRMLSYDEWCKAAHGSPRGHNYNDSMAWTGGNMFRTLTGNIPNAVSVFGLKDCVGNVQEWLSNLLLRPDGAGAWGWKKNYSNRYDGKTIEKGSLYMFYPVLVGILAGGKYNDRNCAGPVTLTIQDGLWYTFSSNGVRGASNSI